LRPFSFSFSIPKKLFIGLESPVPPRIFPVANLSANLRSASDCLNWRRYQTNVFWHHAMKAVAPQTSPRAAID